MTSILGKAFRNEVPVPMAPRSALAGGLRSIFTNDMTRQLDAYGEVGTLFSIVNRTSNATSQIEWALYRKPRDGRRTTAPALKPQRVEVTRHAALDLWANPNPYMVGQEFREAAQQHVDLVGESTIVIYRSPLSPMPLELWPVRPDRMTPVPGEKTFLAGWIYTGPNGERVPLRVDEVLQIKMPNPADPYRGLGPVQAALVDLDSAKYSAEWNRQFFLNSAEPGGHLEVDEELDDEDFKKLQQQWGEQHQGISNAHRVAILEGGVKWKDRTFSPKDMQFDKLRNVSREMIREAFGIHGHMLGNSQDVNKANAEAGEISFARWLVYPRAQRWKSMLNARLLPMFDAAEDVEFDHMSVVPEDREADDRERTSQTQAWATLVNAGADPDDAADVVGLPHMRTKEPNPAPVPAE